MKNKEEIRKLFDEDKQSYYDFSQAPALIRVKGRNALEENTFKGHDMSRWMNLQLISLDWTNDKRVFTKEYIESSRATYDLPRALFVIYLFTDRSGGIAQSIW